MNEQNTSELRCIVFYCIVLKFVKDNLNWFILYIHFLLLGSKYQYSSFDILTSEILYISHTEASATAFNDIAYRVEYGFIWLYYMRFNNYHIIISVT